MTARCALVLWKNGLGHVRYLSISVHTISVPKSTSSVPRDHFGTCQVRYMGMSYSAVKLFFWRIPTYVITVPNRHGQTDRRTTYDSNAALCTKVHRAVIKSFICAQCRPKAQSEALVSAFQFAKNYFDSIRFDSRHKIDSNRFESIQFHS